MDISVITVAGDHRARQKLSLSNIDVSFPKYSSAIGLCLQSSSESTWWLRQRGQAQPRRLGGMFGKRDVAKHQGPLPHSIRLLSFLPTTKRPSQVSLHLYLCPVVFSSYTHQRALANGFAP